MVGEGSLTQPRPAGVNAAEGQLQKPLFQQVVGRQLGDGGLVGGLQAAGISRRCSRVMMPSQAAVAMSAGTGSLKPRSSAKTRQGSCSRCQRLMPRNTPRPKAFDVSMSRATRLGTAATGMTLLAAMPDPGKTVIQDTVGCTMRSVAPPRVPGPYSTGKTAAVAAGCTIWQPHRKAAVMIGGRKQPKTGLR